MQGFWTHWAAGLVVGMAGMLLGGVAGCGPQLVEPGGTQSPRSAPPTLDIPARRPAPAANNAMGNAPSTLEDLPRVPADSVIREAPDSGPARYHEVVSGDTLSSIARRYGTTVERLVSENGLQRDGVLLPGQLLYIPDVE